MTDIDDKIREALGKEDAELLERFRGEPSIQEQVLATFRGRQGWLAMLVFASTIVILGLLVFIGYQFFAAETDRGMIGWSTGFLWGIIWIAMLKIWYWGELSRHALTREIKRLELQVAQLSRKLTEEGK